MKKAIILGGGFAGCAMAHQFEINGNWDVEIIEKSHFLGAGVRTFWHGGHPYTFGPRHFLTEYESVYEYLNNLCPLRKLKHEMVTYVEQDNKFYNFPMHFDDINIMPDKDTINKELKEVNLNNIKNSKNLEEYWLNSVGPTLYKKFVENYNKKMWMVNSNKELDTFEWSQKIEVTKQREIGEQNEQVPVKSPIKSGPRETYDNSISCYPYAPDGYNNYFEISTQNAKVHLSTTFENLNIEKKYITIKGQKIFYDILINTLSPDILFEYCFGELKFIGRDFMKIVLPIKDVFPNDIFFLYYANDEQFTRIVEYKKFTLHDSENSLIGLEIPSNSGKHYPMPIKKELERASKYFSLLPENIFSIGRAGSYDYNIDIDDCIYQSMNIAKNL